MPKYITSFTSGCKVPLLSTPPWHKAQHIIGMSLLTLFWRHKAHNNMINNCSNRLATPERVLGHWTTSQWITLSLPTFTSLGFLILIYLIKRFSWLHNFSIPMRKIVLITFFYSIQVLGCYKWETETRHWDQWPSFWNV